MWGGEELLTLDYGKLMAALWGVCKRLQARVEALEKRYVLRIPGGDSALVLQEKQQLESFLRTEKF